MNPPIIISFIPNNLGRVVFTAEVRTGDGLSLGPVRFKLDSGSDFTTLSCEDLDRLGYTEEFLTNCPEHEMEDNKPITMADGTPVVFRYIQDMAIKFKDRELQGCRIFFALGTGMRSLLGSDILKYFNREIDYDAKELRLKQRINFPSLSKGEKPIQVYSVERMVSAF